MLVLFLCHNQLIAVMAAGAKNRVTAATGMNQGSSRSHSVFIISLQQVGVRALIGNLLSVRKLETRFVLACCVWPLFAVTYPASTLLGPSWLCCCEGVYV